MTVGIYAIYSTFDEQCLYIGQSSNIEQRFRQHITKLKNKRDSALKDFVDWYHLYDANETVLKLEILKVTTNDDFEKNLYEAKYFDKLSPKFYGKVPSLSETWTHSTETIEKIRRGAQVNAAARAGLDLADYQALPRSGKNVKLYTFDCLNKTCLQSFMTHKKTQKYCSVRCGRLGNGVSMKLDHYKIEKLFIDDNTSIRQIAKELNVNKNEIRFVLHNILGYNIATKTRS